MTYPQSNATFELKMNLLRTEIMQANADLRVALLMLPENIFTTSETSPNSNMGRLS
jgi:hypothetical protein